MLSVHMQITLLYLIWSQPSKARSEYTKGLQYYSCNVSVNLNAQMLQRQISYDLLREDTEKQSQYYSSLLHESECTVCSANPNSTVQLSKQTC